MKFAGVEETSLEVATVRQSRNAGGGGGECEKRQHKPRDRNSEHEKKKTGVKNERALTPKV